MSLTSMEDRQESYIKKIRIDIVNIPQFHCKFLRTLNLEGVSKITYDTSSHNQQTYNGLLNDFFTIAYVANVIIT